MKLALLPATLLPATLSAETSLKEQLEARSQQAAQQIPAEIRTEFAKGIQAVEKAKITDQAKQIGDLAPNFTLKNHQGTEVSLANLLKDGPVLLTWYRGGWCPYCNIALAALQKELPAIKKAGATLVALTPELPDKSAATIEKGSLQFHVLTDLNHQIAKEYGLLFKLTPTVTELYKGFFDLHEYNGKEAGNDTLPLAATYIINTDRTITYAFLKADYRQRAEPSDLIKELQKLK
ncbi:MAG: peroxiredoxin-like family protein [Verrucomicrobiota bacterium]